MTTLRQRIITAQEHAQAKHDIGAGHDALQWGSRADALAEVLTWLDGKDPQEWSALDVVTVRSRCNINADRSLRDAHRFEHEGRAHRSAPCWAKAESLRDAASVWQQVAAWIEEGVPADVTAASVRPQWVALDGDTLRRVTNPDARFGSWWVKVRGRAEPLVAAYNERQHRFCSIDSQGETQCFDVDVVTHVATLYLPVAP